MKALDFGLRVDNASQKLHSFFLRDELKHIKLVNVIVTAVTAFAHAFGRRFVAKELQCQWYFVFQFCREQHVPVAGILIFKAYVTSLSLTLREELSR